MPLKVSQHRSPIPPPWKGDTPTYTLPQVDFPDAEGIESQLTEWIYKPAAQAMGMKKTAS